MSAGFQTLLDAGRLDLAVETIVLKPRFRSLFTEAEQREAQRRLDEYFDYPHERQRLPPEDVFPDELAKGGDYQEGGVVTVTVNRYERDPKARKACLAKHGYRCSVCMLSFEERYGSIGAGFIHVHHKKPLATRRGTYRLDPIKDLVPVCPNCHAMLHLFQPPLSVDELKKLLK